MRVVATAGHVDHGKSTLVLALTGTDPDRFPEEKARGLTIDLGFAFTDAAVRDEVGFVDVPGHVRFVKNMLAGVGAVDVAMLVVAANEGWKPQSEEHLRILDLLDVRHGVVALTKADTVDAETLEHAQLEVASASPGSSLAARRDRRVRRGVSGRGLDDLRAALDAALAAPPALDDDRPRLWIDRVFAPRGAGTVVTGTLTGGAVAVDDARRDRRHVVRCGSGGSRPRTATSSGSTPGRGSRSTSPGSTTTRVGRGDAARAAGPVAATRPSTCAVVPAPEHLPPTAACRRRLR